MHMFASLVDEEHSVSTSCMHMFASLVDVEHSVSISCMHMFACKWTRQNLCGPCASLRPHGSPSQPTSAHLPPSPCSRC